jgi:hypothetical protein
MDNISSASIACGFHAGDPGTMRSTLAVAREEAGGDRRASGFPISWASAAGRSRPRLLRWRTSSSIRSRRWPVWPARRSLRLQHVKAHGALCNMACRDRALADAIARAVAAFDPDLILFGLPNSELLNAGRTAGLRWLRKCSPIAPTIQMDPSRHEVNHSVIHDAGGRRACSAHGEEQGSRGRRRIGDSRKPTPSACMATPGRSRAGEGGACRAGQSRSADRSLSD